MNIPSRTEPVPRAVRILEQVPRAVRILEQGGIIVYPTESSYGLGCDAINRGALQRIFSLKWRAAGKKVPVIVSDVRVAARYYQLDERARSLIKAFMPGPLTLVAPKKNLPGEIGGFRISSHPFARALARSFGKPVVATSANLSGRESVYAIAEVMRFFGETADLIVDGGNLPAARPSTVFDVAKGTVIREGPISEAQLMAALRL